MEEKLKTAKASWNITLYVDCPHCKEYFDIMTCNSWTQGGYEGIETAQREDLDLEITCPKCEKDFLVDEAEY